MQLNPGHQNAAKSIWNGTVAGFVDIRRHVNFSFTFEVAAPIAVDAVFNVQAAPPSDADPCVPGTFVPVPEVLTCLAGFDLAIPEDQATVVIPKDTPVGSLCTATLPCRPDAFVRLMPGSGDTADVRIIAGLHGPKV